MDRRWGRIVLAMVVAVAVWGGSRAPALALDVTVNTTCDEAELAADISDVVAGNGGTVRFDCPVSTIAVTLPKVIGDTTQPVIIDGSNRGGRMTLTGSGITNHFVTQASAKLELRTSI